jgi:nucleoid DNA-binding protein
MTLTKRDLVLRICEVREEAKQRQFTQQDVFDIVQQTFDEIVKALAKGEKVELRNFGIFEVRVRKARIGRNPSAPGSQVPIPERSVVKFKAGREMRLAVGKLGPTLGVKSPGTPPEA